MLLMLSLIKLLNRDKDFFLVIVFAVSWIEGEFRDSFYYQLI